MRAQLALATLIATSTAHADGVYFAESFGVGRARGALEPTVGNAIQSQLALGARVDWLGVEAFIGSNMQTDRVGAFKGFAGGEPAEGRADLGSYGFAVVANAPLYRAPSSIVEGYVRVAPSIISGTGALADYRGTGIGASAGLRIRGSVRALGFVWAPLFFVKKGPKVTGSIFLDQGWDFVTLKREGMETIDARIGHVTVGFSIGTTL